MKNSFDREITINLCSQQQEQLSRESGIICSEFVLKQVQLVVLSLAAEAAGISSIPLSKKDSTISQMLEYERDRERDLENASTFFVKLNLTLEQKSQIEKFINKPVTSLLVAPDEWSISFEEDWTTLGNVFSLGKSIVIIPEGTDYQENESEHIVLLPSEKTSGNVFGIGTHPTTQMLVMFLEKYIKSEDYVLDIGTGSGILALVAARLGAQKVLGIDIDPAAVATAKETANLNQLNHVIEVIQGSMEVIEHKSYYDVVIANIFPSYFVAHSSALVSTLKPSGMLIVSGIVKFRVKEIIRLLSAEGLILEEQTHLNGWCGLVFSNMNKTRS